MSEIIVFVLLYHKKILIEIFIQYKNTPYQTKYIFLPMSMQIFVSYFLK